MSEEDLTLKQRRERAEKLFISHKQPFCYGVDKLTPADYAERNNLPLQEFVDWCARKGWVKERNEYWKEVNSTVRTKQVNSMSYDIVTRLQQIRRMKDQAYEAAMTERFKLGAGDAVRSYAELEKLERLLLDKSTQKFEIDTGKQMVSELLRIIRDEVSDVDVLRKIAARVQEAWAVAGQPTDFSPEVESSQNWN